MSEIDIEKYRSGEITHYTDPITSIVWHNGKFVEKLKQQLQLEKDNVAELNELLASYKEENEYLAQENNELQTRLDIGRWSFEELTNKLRKIEKLLENWDCEPRNMILQIIEECE